MNKKTFLIVLILVLASQLSNAQTATTTDSVPAKTTDTVPAKKMSKFDAFNQKAEALFKIIPVPIISYSSDAGNVFGLAKNNVFELSKKDTISKPSRLSEVVTFSTKGRINASVSTELIFNHDKNIVIGYINYKKQPEYLLGIGNDVTRDGLESVQHERVKFFATGMKKIKEHLYFGIPLDFAYYFNIKPDSGANSFLVKDNVTGLKGGVTFGTGLGANYDSRQNRYNPTQGIYAMAIWVYHPKFLSEYEFTHFEVDLRKYFSPWKKHVIAIQATTTATGGNTPYYELAKMGGEKQMRGYYEGAYRDKVLVDGQLEYRLPVWNIFGVVGWIGTGRVATGYDNLSFEGWKLSYGGGIRIRVDTKHNTNLRIDFGYGPHGVSAAYFNFAEAF